MATHIGIWLDRSDAIIIRIKNTTCETLKVSSGLVGARHPRCGTEGHCTLIPEKRLRLRRQELVQRFYRRIVEIISNAEAILILGPGLAKTEFAKEIAAVKQLRSRIMGIEIAAKMSTPQIKAKVVAFFEGRPSAAQTNADALGTLSPAVALVTNRV